MKTTSFVGLGAIGALAMACSSSSGSPPNGGSSSGSDSGSSSSGGASSGGGSGSSSGSGSGSGSGSSSGSGSGDDAGAYPPAPYGMSAGGNPIAVGSVFPDMQWIGYVDPMASAVATTEPYVAYTMNDARTSGARWAMVHLAESDCPGCQAAASQLETGAASVVQAGGVVIEVLETTGFVEQATQTSLQQWIGKYQLMITSVKDPDGTGTVTLDTLGSREHAYIVDLTTMKVAYVYDGDDSGGGAATAYSVNAAMAEMHTLLGK